eukprot:8540393-Pyramimonas_sp.AAC.1
MSAPVPGAPNGVHGADWHCLGGLQEGASMNEWGRSSVGSEHDQALEFDSECTGILLWRSRVAEWCREDQ